MLVCELSPHIPSYVRSFGRGIYCLCTNVLYVFMLNDLIYDFRHLTFYSHHFIS